MLADSLRDLFVGQGELGRQGVIALRLVDRIQVFALDILHESQLEQLAVVDFLHERWNVIDSSELSGSQTALARDELESILAAPDEDRLQHAGGENRVRQLAQRWLVEPGAWLKWIRLDLINRDFADARAWRFHGARAARGNERFQSLSKRLPMHDPSPPAPVPDNFRRPCCVGRRERSAFQTTEPRSSGHSGGSSSCRPSPRKTSGPRQRPAGRD